MYFLLFLCSKIIFIQNVFLPLQYSYTDKDVAINLIMRDPLYTYLAFEDLLSSE